MARALTGALTRVLPRVLTGALVLMAVAVAAGAIAPARAQLDAAPPNTAANPSADTAANTWTRFADTPFDGLDAESGLPHNVVLSLAQDSLGFIWMGSQGGLARFDGYRFKVFHHIAGDATSLPDNYVQTLLTDRQGRLWVGTISDGLAHFDPATERFQPYSTAQGLSDVNVTALAEGPDGSVWVGTPRGLDRLDPATGAITHLRHDAANTDSLPDDRVRALARDGDGRLWIGTAAGLVWLAPDGGLSRTAFTDAVTALALDDQGRLWVGGAHAGIAVVDKGGHTPRPLPLPASETNGGPSPTVTAITPVRQDRVWVATRSGIQEWEGLALHQIIRHDPLVQDSLPDDYVRSLLRDRSGLIWVGTNRGTQRHDPSTDGIRVLYGNPGRQDRLSDRDIMSVTVMPDGHVLAGTLRMGINDIDLGGGHIEHRSVARDGLDRVQAAALWDGALWIGGDEGLYRLPDANGRATRPARRMDQVPPQRIIGLLADGDGLWVAGNETGLYRLHRTADGGYERETPWWDGALGDPHASALYRDHVGAVWVGTQHGLSRLDVAARTVTTIQAAESDPTALSAGFITTIAEDERGRLWVGTLGGGINVAVGDTPDGHRVFKRLGTTDGLPHLNIGALLRDRQGRMWASTANGIAVIDPTTFAIRAMGKADGVRVRGYWIGSGAMAGDGRLLFGGAGGMTVIAPDRLPEWRFRPPLVITDLRVDQHPVVGAALNRPLSLAPGTHGFSADFAALDYSAPDRIRYAYRLEGYDTAWIEADGSRRTATYTNLPPGHYALQVRGANRQGAWIGAPLTLDITMRPAWYQTLAAKVAGAALALGAVVGLVMWWTARLHRLRRLLERQVAARTQALNEANRALARLAHFDALTGLANRRRLLDMAGMEIDRSQRYGHGLTLVLIDLDHFKQVNDSYGHAAGDAALQMVALCLEEGLRGCDTAARLGGEEFAALLPETDLDGALQMAERFRQSLLAQPITVGGASFTITASIGVAQWWPGESDIQPALARADVALYRVKAGGRNGVAVEPHPDATAHRA